MYEDQSGEFTCGYWGLKGYNPQVRRKNNELSPGISSTWVKVFMNLFCYYHLSYFFLQEAIKKKLEIQKQKQELLNKQIKEQKVKIMNFIAAICLTTYPLHICWVFLRLLAAHLVSLRTVKFVGRRNKRLLTEKGIRQDKKRQIADSFGVNKLSITQYGIF